MTSSAAQLQSPAAAPWWRHGHVWLLLSGPLAVILAGLWTAWLALHGSDPVVEPDYYRRGIEINRTLKAQPPVDAERRAHLPAVQGRNHVVTPAADPAGR